MRQLILDLLPESPPTLDNFVAGGNAETVAALTEWLAGGLGETSFCLYGESGCGRSHLLLASGFRLVDATLNPSLAGITVGEPLAVDNVDALNADGQIALFALFNQIKLAGGQLLTAAAQPPAHLALREDLRTRLGWGHVFGLLPLSEAEQRAVLRQVADARGVFLGDEVMDFMLTRFSRDMGSLMELLELLDAYALQTKRAITIPLIKSMMENV